MRKEGYKPHCKDKDTTTYLTPILSKFIFKRVQSIAIFQWQLNRSSMIIVSYCRTFAIKNDQCEESSRVPERKTERKYNVTP